MKARTLLLAALSMTVFTAFAQEEEEYEKDLTTLQFVDKQGNVVEDGAVITLDEVTGLDSPMPEVNTGMTVKNTTAEEVTCNVDFDILSIDNGALSCCFPQSCAQVSEAGLYSTLENIVAGNANHPFNTEWYPDTYGACKATFQIYYWGQVLLPGQFIPINGKTAMGPKITINFVYNDPAAINGVTNDGAAHAVAFYNAKGQQISQLESGLNIIKYSNGKTVKTVIK